jgi:hypothetical protein
MTGQQVGHQDQGFGQLKLLMSSQPDLSRILPIANTSQIKNLGGRN